jgi:DNA-binding helix-hairpin-helix protein with protein kinase domain
VTRDPVQVTLGECIARGGEASIMTVPANPRVLAKIYHQPTDERAEKLAVMIERPPATLHRLPALTVAWPLRRIAAPDSRRVIGFLMPRVPAATPAAMLHNMKSRLVANPRFTWRYLVRAATNLAAVVEALHAAGCVMGDVNDQGVLVSDTALVTLVDCDSFQIADPETGRVFRSTVGTGAFTPPELAGCRFDGVDRTPDHDRFGLAVVIYQFLMGCHPFQVTVEQAGPIEKIDGDKGDDPVEVAALEDAIRQGLYADSNDTVEPPPMSPPLALLPDSTRALFRAAFAPLAGSRPTAASWARELWTLERDLNVCAQNANHLFPRHLTACPWCDRIERLGGRDPFPSVQAIESGEHLRRAPTTPYSWSSPRPRAHPDRRIRWRLAHERAQAREWRPRSR